MACGSCGSGKPNGCKSNGGCSSGGCSRMNVFDWLSNLPFSDPESSCKIIEVSFNKGSRKDYYRNPTMQYLEKGTYVTVEGAGGFDVGTVNLSGELVRLQLKKYNVAEDAPDMKKVLRPSTERDIELYHTNKEREHAVLMRSREIARELKLQMKLSEVELQADGKKATFFYTADDRVDFREMIKMFASEFRVKVEMRQIGIRQEASKVGGIGSCGRELCCSTWLTDFKSVTTTAARYQNLSINQTKLSGQCGRLKCCLNFELDTYMDALQQFPKHADSLETEKGRAQLIKKDIFKNLLWYTLPDSNKQYPLTIKRVKEIQEMNAKGEKPFELGFVELTSVKESVEVDKGFVDVVGQISLKSLEKNAQKRNNRYNKSQNHPNQKGKNPTNSNQNQKGNNNNNPSQAEQRQNREKTDFRSNSNNNNNKPVQKNRPNNNRGTNTNRSATPGNLNPANRNTPSGKKTNYKPNRFKNNRESGEKPSEG